MGATVRKTVITKVLGYFRIALYLSMRRSIAAFCFVFISLSTVAQKPKELWILKYVKALQPLYTMVEIDGKFEFEEEDPQDSSFLYNSGLMTLRFAKKNKAISHSWDGKEEWNYTIDQNSIQLFGKRDTLYGELMEEQLILSSTLDDRPTFYHFEKLEEEKLSTLTLAENNLRVSVKNHFFDNNVFLFVADSIKPFSNVRDSESKVHFTYQLGKLNAIEYDFYPKDSADFKQELGTIYFYKTDKKTIKGFFYPIYDGLNEPEKKTLTLSPLKN